MGRVGPLAPMRLVPPSQARQVGTAATGNNGNNGKSKNEMSLDERIASGEFDDSGSTKEKITRPLRKALAKEPFGVGRALSLWLAKLGQQWRRVAAERMPVATGDIREIIGQPVFVPLYTLFKIYGKVFRLSFGPKSFVIVSDAEVAKYILRENADNYSKGLLSEILDFVMGTGLIPADGEVWKVRRRAIVPALHKKYIDAMISMFGESALHGTNVMVKASEKGEAVEMENYFSRLALDIIGKAVFNYDFDSLTHDDPVIKAVYTVLREAEYRSTYPIPYWNVPPLRAVVPRQRECDEALKIVTDTLDELITGAKRMVEENDEEFVEEFLSKADPSILYFLIASGDDITSKQLRDDLMTLLIAGHETTAAVLTWTMQCVVDDEEVTRKLQEEADRVLGDRLPTLEDLKELKYTTRVINESMRLYPQPPVLIRRALEDDVLGGYVVEKGSDLFISVWNLHRNPDYWPEPDKFDPGRFPVDEPMPNEITEDFRYLPFGGGKRKCVGDMFALYESVAALAILMRRFDFARPADKPAESVGMTTGATIHTLNGLYLKPSLRKHASADESAVPSRAEAEREVIMAFTSQDNE